MFFYLLCLHFWDLFRKQKSFYLQIQLECKNVEAQYLKTLLIPRRRIVCKIFAFLFSFARGAKIVHFPRRQPGIMMLNVVTEHIRQIYCNHWHFSPCLFPRETERKSARPVHLRLSSVGKASVPVCHSTLHYNPHVCICF